MQSLLAKGSPFESISTSAALVLNSCANIKIKINQNKETTDMCKALREIQQEAVEKAVGEAVEKEQKKQQEAVEKTTVNSLLRTARALMANLSWSADQALLAMSVSESERAALRPMLQA